MHASIKLDKPIEFVDIDPNFNNPLISKCRIKVCYVGDKPNRNKSVITKEVAKKELAQSVRGAIICGFYNEEKQDFEEHNRMIDISNGKFEIKDTTRPYGFVDMNAKVWFEWFEDDGVPHEYLMTEGYLWTGQYPECRRVVERGNNQSMELDQDYIKANWTKDVKGKPEFFIINEAIMSKLCILGEDVEPCFEGASISSIQFSFDDNFKSDWANMMNQMKEILKNEGGAPVFKYTVNSTSDKAPIEAYINSLESNFSLVECYTEEDQNFAILQKDNEFFRMNYSYENEEIIADEPVITNYGREWGYDEVRVTEIVESVSCRNDEEGRSVEERVISTTEHITSVSGPVEEPVVEEPVAAEYSENIENSEEFNEYALDEQLVVEPAEKTVVENEAEVVEEADIEEAVVEEEVAEEILAETEVKEPAVEEVETPVEEVAFSVIESEEYMALQGKYAEMEANYTAALGLITELKNEKETINNAFVELQDKYSAIENKNIELEETLNNLNEFKLSVEREKKQAMIDKFYMLNDADKVDVVANIDTYSLDEIEAKLCVACFRNHVSFDEVGAEPKPVIQEAPVVYTLGSVEEEEDYSEPAWLKRVRATQKNLNN